MTIKGSALILSQYVDYEAQNQSLDSIARRAAQLGFAAIQIPCSSNPRIFDVARAAESQAYCDDVHATVSQAGLEISALCSSFEGQLLGALPGASQLCDYLAPQEVRGDGAARRSWAKRQIMLASKASRNLGLTVHITHSGATSPAFVHSLPRPAGDTESVFTQFGSQWVPLLDAFDEAGVDICFDLDSSAGIHNTARFEYFLDPTHQHPRARILYDPSQFVLNQWDYLEFLDQYHPLIGAVRLRDAEFRSRPVSSVYGANESWMGGFGRFRSLGDGKIDFTAIFRRLVDYRYSGWAAFQWNPMARDPEAEALNGAAFLREQLEKVQEEACAQFVMTAPDRNSVSCALGL